MIPKEFEQIPNVGDYLTDLEHKRLTDSERETLKRVLLGLYLEDFVAEVSKNHKLKPYINGSDPSAVLRVRTQKQNYWAVRFSNGVEVKCTKELFVNAPYKEDIARLY